MANSFSLTPWVNPGKTVLPGYENYIFNWLEFNLVPIGCRSANAHAQVNVYEIVAKTSAFLYEGWRKGCLSFIHF